MPAPVTPTTRKMNNARSLYRSRYTYEGLDKEDWQQSTYAPPKLSLAKDARREEMFMDGRAPICGPMDHMDSMGVGLGLYFRLIKYLAILFFFMSLLATPAIIICRVGNRVASEDVDPLTLNLFSLANIGEIHDPACDDPATYHLVDDLEACNATTIEVLGRDVEETDISLLISLCDFAYSVLFMMFIWFLGKRIKKVAYVVDGQHTNIADYAVYVKNLPANATEGEIRHHFNSLYDLSQEDWTFEGYCCGCCSSKTVRRRTHDHQLRKNMDTVQRFFGQKVDEHQAALVENAPVKDISNTLNPDYLGSWVAEVTLAHPNGALIRKYMAQEKRLEKLRQLKATYLRHKPGAAHADPVRLTKTQKKLDKLNRDLDKFDFKHAAKLSSDTVAAFVVFNCEDSRRFCVDDYESSTTRCGRYWMPKPLMFRKDIPLEVIRATEPSDVIWENIETTHAQRRRRVCFVYTIMALLLLASVVAMAVAQHRKAEFEKSVPNLDVCDVELPAVAFGSYDDVPSDIKLFHNEDLDESYCKPDHSRDFFISYEGYNHTAGADWGCAIPSGSDPQCVDADSSTQCTALNGVTFTQSSLVGCFCVQELERLIDDKGIFSGARALIRDEGDACLDFAINYSLGNILLLVAASLVVFTNTILKVILRRVTRFERHDTNTAMERAISIKVFFAQFINTGLVTLLVNAKLSSSLPDEVGIGAGEFSRFEPRWYSVVGTSILITMVINVIAPHLLPLLHMTIAACKRTKQAIRTAVTQRQLDDLFAPRTFMLSTRYPVILNTLFVSLVYSSGLPILIPIAFVAFLLSFWVDKCTLLRLYGKPPTMGTDLANFSHKLTPWALFLHLGFSVWMYGDTDTLVSEPVDFGNEDWEKQYNEYIDGEGSKFDEIDLVPKLLRQNVFPIAFLLFCLIFSKTLWKFLGRPVKNLVLLILYVLCCCFLCKREGDRLKHHHPRFTAPFVIRLDVRDKVKLTEKERAEGWRIVDDPTRPPTNGIRHRAKVKVWLEAGIHRRIRHQKGQTKLTWQVVEERYTPTYQIIAQPKYRGLMSALLDAKDKVTNAAMLSEQTVSPFAPQQYSTAQAPQVESQQTVPVFQHDYYSAQPAQAAQGHPQYANPAYGGGVPQQQQQQQQAQTAAYDAGAGVQPMQPQPMQPQPMQPQPHGFHSIPPQHPQQLQPAPYPTGGSAHSTPHPAPMAPVSYPAPQHPQPGMPPAASAYVDGPIRDPSDIEEMPGDQGYPPAPQMMAPPHAGHPGGPPMGHPGGPPMGHPGGPPMGHPGGPGQHPAGPGAPMHPGGPPGTAGHGHPPPGGHPQFM